MSQANARLLSVLDALERAASPLTSSELARVTGLSGATAWRVLQSLTEWGGVERQSDGRYRISTRLWAVGSSAPCVQRLQHDTFGHLRSLADETGLGASLSVYDGEDAIVVSTAGDAGPLHQGDRITVGSTAIGRVFAAAQDAHLRGREIAWDRTPHSTCIATSLIDPAGAVVGVVSLTGRSRGNPAVPAAALRKAIPQIRFSVYRDELFV